MQASLFFTTFSKAHITQSISARNTQEIKENKVEIGTKKLKLGKALGKDEIAAEMMKCIDDCGKTYLLHYYK